MVLILTAYRRFGVHLAAVAVLLLALLALAACGSARSSSGEPQVEPLSIRSPHPTFTATPRSSAPGDEVTPTPGVTSATVAGGGASSPSTTPQPSAATDKANLVINADMVYLRQGPGTEADYITLLSKGQEFDIVGKNVGGDWWFVCCWEEKAGWVNGEFSDVTGPLDQVPVVADNASGATPTSQAAGQPNQPTAASPPWPLLQRLPSRPPLRPTQRLQPARPRYHKEGKSTQRQPPLPSTWSPRNNFQKPMSFVSCRPRPAGRGSSRRRRSGRRRARARPSRSTPTAPSAARG